MQATVRKARHSRKRFDYWLCVLPGRVTRTQFAQLRFDCEKAGGWYSRAWGGVPGGFAFREEQAARDFAASLSGVDAETEAEQAPTPARPVAQMHSSDYSPANDWRERADRLQERIDEKLRPLGQNWTPRRGRQLESRQQDGRRWRRVQRALRAMADAWERDGKLPAGLAGVRDTYANLYGLCGSRHEMDGHGDYIDTGERGDDSPEAVALWDLMRGAQSQADREADASAERERRLERDIDELRQGAPGSFFPTPTELAQRLVDAAGVEAGQMILEPSAGIGSIADLIERATGESPQCVEMLLSAAEILRKKGHPTESADFLAWETGQRFDRVVMNPPFNRGADVKHVRRAAELLGPGGRVVALMSATGATRIAEALTDLPVSSSVREIPGEPFRGVESFRQTGVRVAMVTVDRWEDEEDEPVAEPAAVSASGSAAIPPGAVPILSLIGQATEPEPMQPEPDASAFPAPF